MPRSLLIKNATAILPSGRAQTNLLIEKGVIVSVDAAPTTIASEVVDATGLVLFPGLIDDQVHFRATTTNIDALVGATGVRRPRRPHHRRTVSAPLALQRRRLGPARIFSFASLDDPSFAVPMIFPASSTGLSRLKGCLARERNWSISLTLAKF